MSGMTRELLVKTLRDVVDTYPVQNDTTRRILWEDGPLREARRMLDRIDKEEDL